jgi:hypothetical protein
VAAPAPAAPAAAGIGLPSRDELTVAWGDKVLVGLAPRAKSRFRVGRFVASEGGKATFALPNAIHRDRCEEVRVDVEQALAAHFGRPVPLRLVTDAEVGGAPPPAPVPAAGGRKGKAAAAPDPDPEEIEDVHALEDAPSAGSGAQRLVEAFPGAELLEEP